MTATSSDITGRDDDANVLTLGLPNPEMALSLDFLSRLLRFVAWEPGWDGERAEHIDHDTAVRALVTAISMRAVAPEPFIAPAPSGSLLLQWDFDDGASVEIYVDSETGFPDSAALTCEGIVYEVGLIDPSALRSLLAERATLATAKK